MICNYPVLITLAAVSIGLLTLDRAPERQVLPPAAAGTQVVLLGTGNPPADPDRSGPATAIVVNGTPYLVDFGAGVVRRAKLAAVEKGIPALEPVDLRVVFATHLRSAHSRKATPSMRTTFVKASSTGTPTSR